jgi:hypothetical protein
MKPQTCLIKNCNQDVQTGSSFCPDHHADWLRCGSPEFDELAPWLLQRRMSRTPQIRKEPMSPICLVVGCGSESHTRSLCPKHFGRWESLNRPEGKAFQSFLNMQVDMATALQCEPARTYRSIKNELAIKHGLTQ